MYIIKYDNHVSFQIWFSFAS